MTATTTPAALRAALEAQGAPAADPKAVGAAVAALRRDGLLDLPLPGSGATLRRWEALAELGAHDLAVARLADSHLDAHAIFAEAGRDLPDGVWGVWGANPPDGRLTATRDGDGWRLDGRKRWCSGAGTLDGALVTASDDEGVRVFALRLDDPRLQFDASRWQAVGMALSDTLDLVAEDVRVPAGAELGASPGWYRYRRGFWFGAIGVAATWYGGALGVARTLRAAVAARDDDPFGLAHLGAVDAACAAMHALLATAAAAIDADPTASARTPAMQVRAVVEALTSEVLRSAGRTLGSGMLCTDGAYARRVADLTVYLRQHGAERDLAALGRDVLDTARLT